MGYFGSGISLERGTPKRPHEKMLVLVRLVIFNNNKWLRQHRLIPHGKAWELSHREHPNLADDDHGEISVILDWFGRNPFRGVVGRWRGFSKK